MDFETGAGEIEIVYNDRDPDAKNLGSGSLLRVGRLDTASLKRNLTTLCSHVIDLLEQEPSPRSGFVLDKFTVAVEVTAGGEVRLVGAVNSQVRGGLTIEFRRSK